LLDLVLVEPSCRRPEQEIIAALDIEAALRGHAFLLGLSEHQLATLAQIAEPVEFQEHELILVAKQPSLDLYTLLSGSVSIELHQKHYAVHIQALGAGDAFGCSALLEDHDTMFDVRAREHCTALRLDGGRLRAALRDDPVFAAELFRRTLQLTTRRLHATEVRLGELCGVRIKTTEEGTAAAIRALNKLIEICLDGELGYRTAAEHIQDSKLRTQLIDHAVKRAEFAQELRAEVGRLGGIASHSGTITASLHRGWIALKSAVSGGDPKRIIAACETGEHAAYNSYETASNIDFLPKETRRMIEAQFQTVMQSCEWLRGHS
jgi:uncharacterized protein (TIGR02284 family)